METIKIKNMNWKDFETIEPSLVTEFDDFWTPSILKSELMGKNKKYIVAKKEDTIIGLAGVMMVGSELEIMNIVTKKTERRKGIGNLLLNKILEIANNNDIQKIFLEVNEKNRIAIKMYEKAGFLEVGKRKNYYYGKEDAKLMCYYLQPISKKT